MSKKTKFSLIVFEILLSEGRSVLRPTQRGTGTKRVNIRNFLCKISISKYSKYFWHCEFCKKADFNDKLEELHKTVTSDKTKYVLVEYESNELPEKFKSTSYKGLTKDLIVMLAFLMDQNVFLPKYFKIV